MKPKQRKAKKCKICGKKFIPEERGQFYCDDCLEFSY